MTLSRMLKIYIVPGAVFQSVTVGGGYGTGRELVEYFTQFGVFGGSMGMLLATIGFGVIVAFSFELARMFRAYDYRHFLQLLIGPAWFVFEILFVLMFLLVLAVIGAAAGQIFEEQLGISKWVGVGVMLVAVSAISFYGRDTVTRMLTFWSILLYVVFITYFIMAMVQFGPAIVDNFTTFEMKPGWVVGGLQYVFYGSVLIPIILFSAREIETRKQSFISGGLAAVICMFPGFLFHLTFGATYPDILAQDIPTYWMIQQLSAPWLLTAYLIVLFGTFIETGLGSVQGVNERLDAWMMETRGHGLNRSTHAIIGAVAMMVAAGLSAVGIISLISQGYGTMSWGFMLVYVIPLLTIGTYKIFFAGKSKPVESPVSTQP